MRRILRKISKNKTIIRFVISFIVILCFPIMCFIYIFMQNYSDAYRRKIIEQAEYSLESSGMELVRHIETLQTSVTYNDINKRISKLVIKSDYTGRELTELLGSELITHPILERVFYYNAANPNVVYTNTGTFNMSYFTKLCMGIEEEEFQEFLQAKTLKLMVVNSSQKKNEQTGASLYYLITNRTNECWIFQISLDFLNRTLEADNAVTMMCDGVGNVLYATDQVDDTDIDNYKISFQSPDNSLQLIRYINEERLFNELNTWKNLFFLFVLLLFMLGGTLVVMLTWYNVRPIRRLQMYCQEAVQNLPDNIGGLDLLQFTMKKLNDNNILLERRERINQILLQLIYTDDFDENNMKENMNEIGIFEFAKFYCVVLISGVQVDNESVIDLNKVSLYLKMLNKENYEIRMIDVRYKEYLIMVVGMLADTEKLFSEKLFQIGKDIENSINEEICFYIGDICKNLKDIHVSYTQALSCKQECTKQESCMIVFYKERKEKARSYQYPKEELKKLWKALVEIDIERVYQLTNFMIDVLNKNKINRFVSISLYYDVINTYYRAFMKIEKDDEYNFLEANLLDLTEKLDISKMILHIKEQYRIYVENYGDSDKKKIKKNELILQIMAYIDENATTPELSVSMVSEHFNMTISNISHKFKEYTNRTIIDYITEKKFNYVCELLINTNYNVNEIAFLVGYSHPVSFRRKFKQEYGMTPTEYRMNYKSMKSEEEK